MNERVKLIRKSLKLNQLDFGEKLGLTKSSISNIENGIRNVTDQHTKLLRLNFDVNEEWLKTGKGEMFIENDATIVAELVAEYNLDEMDRTIIEHYLQLDEQTRYILKREVISLAQKFSNGDLEERKIKKELSSYEAELRFEKSGQMSSLLHEEKENY